MNKFVVKDFKPKWKYLKSRLLVIDAKFFEEVVDIESTIGRVISFTQKAYNPRYIQYWFPVCRCHWGVIFPCWLLNRRQLQGDYKIITNDKHSAVINTRTNEIYDPTYSANNSNLRTTLEQFKDDYQIINVLIHAAQVDSKIADRIISFDEKVKLDI